MSFFLSFTSFGKLDMPKSLPYKKLMVLSHRKLNPKLRPLYRLGNARERQLRMLTEASSYVWAPLVNI